MNIHEFQAKGVLRRYGVPVLEGKVATTADEAALWTKELGPVCVVKAQIHAGGRGKAGGVKLCRSPEEARSFAASLLGKPLVTHQTGPEGRIVRRVLVEKGCEIDRELYLAIVIDRAKGWPTLMASAEGGVEI
jgi:succinyl-CoA synthetase beta subunit